MAQRYIEINTDKAVQVKIQALEGNSLPLYFKFLDDDGNPNDVSGVGFVFTVSNFDLTKIELQVINSDWERPSSAEIKKIVTPFNLDKGKYKVDFTATYPDTQIRTLFDGELIVRSREMYGV